MTTAATAAEERTCSLTGLRLRAAVPHETAFRVAKDRGGALVGYHNEYVGELPASVPSEKRGRFDTLGSTIYFADSRRCAYAEVLTGFRQERQAIARAADAAGYSSPDEIDEYIERVTQEARDNGKVPPWSIPVGWQMDRSIYEVRLPLEGWWVVADHADTLTALTKLSPKLGIVFSGDLEGESRATTTSIAQAIRESSLDDGSQALGIDFRSKTLMGRCWAYWDRRSDAGLAPGFNDPVQLISENVGPDPEFQWTADYYGLPTEDPYRA